MEIIRFDLTGFNPAGEVAVQFGAEVVVGWVGLFRASVVGMYLSRWWDGGKTLSVHTVEAYRVFTEL